MQRGMQIGVYTFADTTPDPRTGHVVSPAQRLRNLIEEIELADQVGLDVFGVGEHHRPDSPFRRPLWYWPPLPNAPSGSG